MKNKGFTLVEISVVVGVLITLLGLASINLPNIQQKTSMSTTLQVLISDMKAQQIKAMIGDTEGRPSASAYGVHFEANQYVLFNGSTYSSTDPANFPVSLPSTLQSILPTDIIFSQVSGELAGPSSATIQDITNGQQKTIHLNRYGVVAAVN